METEGSEDISEQSSLGQRETTAPRGVVQISEPARGFHIRENKVSGSITTEIRLVLNFSYIKKMLVYAIYLRHRANQVFTYCNFMPKTHPCKIHKEKYLLFIGLIA